MYTNNCFTNRLRKPFFKIMDDIQKLLNRGGAMLAKIFSGKELKEDFIVDFEFLEPADVYTIAQGLVSSGEYSKAEDFLFYQIEKDYTNELFLLGEELIDKIIDMGDATLQEGDYSLAEAEQFKQDWLKLFVPVDNLNSGEKVDPVWKTKKAKKIAAKKQKRYNEKPQV